MTPTAGPGDQRDGPSSDGEVVVPHTPGPLVRPDRATRRRDHDDLDDIIDELFPQTDESPGWFDACLMAVAAPLAGWALAGGGPGWALAAGAGCLALGAVLPVRWLWRRLGSTRQRRRRRALLAGGVPLRLDDPATARLVRAYDELVHATGGTAPVPWSADPARTAAHSAVLETATLLGGRSVGSDSERDYVSARAAAIGELATALRRHPVVDAGGELDPGLVAAARDDLDALTGDGTVRRLGELAAEARRADAPG